MRRRQSPGFSPRAAVRRCSGVVAMHRKRRLGPTFDSLKRCRWMALLAGGSVDAGRWTRFKRGSGSARRGEPRGFCAAGLTASLERRGEGAGGARELPTWEARGRSRAPLALGGVEPLHGSGCHRCVLPILRWGRLRPPGTALPSPGRGSSRRSGGSGRVPVPPVRDTASRSSRLILAHAVPVRPRPRARSVTRSPDERPHPSVLDQLHGTRAAGRLLVGDVD